MTKSPSNEVTALETTVPPRPLTESATWPVFLTVWCSFFLYGAIAAPVPAVNEPHYLCKAKHFWQPDWCANDFFLQSANAHTVFFATIGSLTQWLSLDQTAWIGRVVAIVVLSAGWCSLLAPLAPSRWFALHVCWLFLAVAACGSLSGEWLVGGVEGKVFSYGFLFGALGQIQHGRPIRAGTLAGLAIAFHPVIGVWGLLAFAGATVVDVGLRTRRRAVPVATSKRGVIASLPGLAALVVCALPGLIPVFSLLTESVPNETKSAANFIQVYYRLAHHLDPMKFLPRAYLGYAALLVVWLGVMFVSRRSDAHRRIDRIVSFAILFAFAGLIIGWGPRPAQGMPYYAERAQLLKFYPFRLADVVVPLAVSIGVATWLQSHKLPAVRFIGCGLLFVAALFGARANVEVNRFSGDSRADWIAACRWIDQHLPADALVHSPHNGWAFKWFARRAEYVAFKDCPQDAAGIVEWNRRLNFLKRWFEEHYDDEFYSADELRALRAQTKITHILTDRLGPLEPDPIFENDTFQVYDLTSLDRPFWSLGR